MIAVARFEVPLGSASDFRVELEGVRDRLAKALNANACERDACAVRADAVLDPRTNFALRVNRVGNQAENHREKADGFRQRGPDQKNLRLHHDIQDIHK